MPATTTSSAQQASRRIFATGKRVDDVGDFRSLPALPAMGAGREFDGIEDGSHVQPRSMRYYFPGNRFLYTSKGSRGRDENPAGVKK